MREYDGIEDDFEKAMQSAMRDDAKAAHDRRMRALFPESRPEPIPMKRRGRALALAGNWPELTNLHADLLAMSLSPTSHVCKWLVWDGADRVTVTLANGSAVYVRTDPAEDGQDAKVITFRLERS